MGFARAVLLALVLSACGTLDTTVQPAFIDDLQAMRAMCAELGPVQLVPVTPAE